MRIDWPAKHASPKKGLSPPKMAITASLP